jgi:hypothetical protein
MRIHFGEHQIVQIAPAYKPYMATLTGTREHMGAENALLKGVRVCRVNADLHPKIASKWQRMTLKLLRIIGFQMEMLSLGGLGISSACIYKKQYVRVMVNQDRTREMGDQFLQLYKQKWDEQDFDEVKSPHSRASGSPRTSRAGSVQGSWVHVEPPPSPQPKEPVYEETPYPTDNPKCYCNMSTVLHRCRREGNNFLRRFHRCQKAIGLQCDFFMWLPDCDQDQWTSHGHVETPRRRTAFPSSSPKSSSPHKNGVRA